MKKLRWFSLLVILCTGLSLALPTAGGAQGIGGQGSPPEGVQAPLAAQSATALEPVAYEYGKIKLSLDAVGTLSGRGFVQVDKPEGATVRKAYLLSATTGFTDYELAPGDITLAGSPVVWEKHVANAISSHNYWTDVTAIVKPIVDKFPTGISSLSIDENSTEWIDGEILAVILDDPNQAKNNTVLLYFGAQDINGDTFVIETGQPLQTDDEHFKIELSLGISYGCVGSSCGPDQHSVIDINGSRLTTSAGGQDDGEMGNGGLITVGGIDDDPGNPADPYALPTSDRADDELYDLEPFVSSGDTRITVDTLNPSVDDNILFAALQLSSTSTVQMVDVTMSLYNNPTTAEDKLKYEKALQYFADGLYEATNGLNKLGKVTIYRNQQKSGEANILWLNKGHPHARISGYGNRGQQISMYDIFQDGNGKGIDYNFLASEKSLRYAGYTLAHEFGHYYFSLYDEYKCSSGCLIQNFIASQPHESDKPVENSMMNSQWNAIGPAGDDFNWLNFSIAKNTTGDTAQFRMYNAAGWATLARPLADDPKRGFWSTAPLRLYHSELVGGLPTGDANSPLELPTHLARSELHIEWVEPEPTSQPMADLSEAVYTIQLNSALGRNIAYPNPILVTAFVQSDLFITDLNVVGWVTLPDSSILPVAFRDDGVSPDVLAADGLYSAIVDAPQAGVYSIDVTMDNHAGKGKAVAQAFLLSTDIFGNAIPYPDPVPITFDFALSTALQVAVSGVMLDDHGSTPASATLIAPDNLDTIGKIEQAGDRDLFRITVPGAGLLYTRVTHLALGMQPRLRVLAADRQTVLYNGTLAGGSADAYLSARIKAAPGATVYLEVSDAAGNAGGLYAVSGGAYLPGDQTDYRLFLSILTK